MSNANYNTSCNDIPCLFVYNPCKTLRLSVFNNELLTNSLTCTDLVVVIASVAVLAIGSNGQVFATSAIR